MPREVTPELVRDALACIPPDIDRDTWARLAMAIKSEFPDETGFNLFDAWSQKGATYKAAAVRDTWRSIKAGGRTTIGTLFGIAKEHGFTFPAASAVQTPEQVAAAAELARKRTEARQQQQAAEAERLQQQHEAAAQRCQAMWDDASAAAPKGGAPYLTRKSVGAHGLRFIRGGTAVVPMRDELGRLWSLQRLLPKRMRDKQTGQETTDKLYGPAKAGPGDEVHSRKAGLFHVLGMLDGAPLALLGEGYATCATLHECTGWPVVVCFDSGNLLHVARALRAKWPALPFLVCGDDDRATEAKGRKNAGRVSAGKAAELAGAPAGLAAVALPAELPDDGSDFNDMAAHVGAARVAEQVRQAGAALLAGLGVEVAGPMAPAAVAAAGTGEAPASLAPVLRLVPGGKADAAADDAAGPPAAADGAGARRRGGGAGGGKGGAGGGGGNDGSSSTGRSRDPFYTDEAGLWYVARDADGNDKPPMWLAEPLHVTANTCDESDNQYGYLIEFVNRRGNGRMWAAPSALFGGDSNEWAAKLRDMGLRMATGARARNLVGQYIDSRKPAEWVTCTDRVGWHGGVYVLPSRCIGTVEGKRYVFQSDSGMEDLFRRRGTMEQWQNTVARPVAGNSRLVFAMCCAFAGPVLRLVGMQTGGIHITGDSSLGKTTALLLAASVYGSPKFKQQWRTTDNGLEGVAVQSSDSLLILDEIGQMDGRVVGDCAYMLGNEAEKIRGSRSLIARRRRTWCLLFLSSGEKDLATHMQEAGKNPQEGQLVRMPSVPGDAGAGLGMLEDLHGMAEGPGAGKAFAEALTAGAAAHFGHAGAAWIEWLANNLEAVKERAPAEMRRMEAAWVPDNAHPQVWRVCSRFALVAAAGELAAEAGIVPWEPGEAERGARRCFEAWLQQRGHSGNGEEQRLLRQVRLFLEKNGSALFQWTTRANDDHHKETPLRCGFKRYVDESGAPLHLDASTDYMDAKSMPSSSPKHAADIEYMILPESFRREVCKGVDHKAVAELLKRRKHLIHQPDRLMNKQRLPGMGKNPVPVYHVRPSIFADDSLNDPIC